MGPFDVIQIPNSGPSKIAMSFRDWIATGTNGYQDDAMNLVTVEVPLFSHDLRTKPEIRMAMGRLLKSNNKIREVMATALFNLRRNRKLEAAIDPLKQIYQVAYDGLNLRTVVDKGAERGLYESQKRIHSNKCKELNLTLIYVATSIRQDAEHFRIEAQQMGHSVIGKVDLLSKIERISVSDSLDFESLSPSQQCALDFEILSRSSFYSGPEDDSFTLNLALRRASYGEVERLSRLNASEIAAVYPSVVYDNNLSQINSRGYSVKGPDPVELYAPWSMYP